MTPFNILAVRRTQLALIMASAIAMAVVTSTHIAGNLSARGAGAPYRTVLAVELLQWLTWAAFVPVISMVERHVGVRSTGWRRGLLAHFAVALGAFAINNLVMTVAIELARLGETKSFGQIFIARGVSRLPEALGTYALIAGILLLTAATNERYRQEARTAQLESQLADARLRALQSQLQPHFLFNTLNLVAGLVREHRNETAVETVAELSDLLRRTLRDMGRPEVSLDDELAWLDAYCSIMKRRFGDLLTIQRDIAIDTRPVLIPPFLLQPLVENAVTHGMESSRHGTIVLRARRADGALRLEVEDDGAGFHVEAVEHIGLAATRERLALRYGSAATLEVINVVPRGALVRITLPWRIP